MSLIDCPKCGFNQPQDTYCASCGVNIASYRPSRTALLLRLASSPYFYVFLVATTLGFFVVKILPHQQQFLTKKILNPPPIKKVIRTQKASLASSSKKNSKKRGLAPQPKAAPTPVETLAQKSINETSTTTTATAAITESERLKFNKLREHLRLSKATISFHEWPREFLSQVLQKSQRINENNLLQASFYTPEKENLLNSLTTTSLGRKTSRQLSEKSQEVLLNFHYNGKDDSDLDKGLSLQIIFAKEQEGIFNMDLEALLNLPETEESSGIQRNIASTYNISQKGYLVITEALPRGFPLPADTSRLQNSPLRILSSENFQNEVTEFVILVEFN